MSSLREELAKQPKVPYIKDSQITQAKYEIMKNKMETIKEACTRLKNSAVSKNDALREIKNIILSKDEDDKVWKSLLGDAYQGK